jgi:hypothetical protein
LPAAVRNRIAINDTLNKWENNKQS